jgi:hypothetical protein
MSEQIVVVSTNPPVSDWYLIDGTYVQTNMPMPGATRVSEAEVLLWEQKQKEAWEESCAKKMAAIEAERQAARDAEQAEKQRVEQLNAETAAMHAEMKVMYEAIMESKRAR